MATLGYDNFRWTSMIRFVGTIFLPLILANVIHANSADFSVTVTVAPRVEALTASAIPLGSGSINPGQETVAVMALSVRMHSQAVSRVPERLPEW